MLLKQEKRNLHTFVLHRLKCLQLCFIICFLQLLKKNLWLHCEPIRMLHTCILVFTVELKLYIMYKEKHKELFK